jgi:hypothetical protein
MTRRVSLPGVDELFRSGKDNRATTPEPEVSQAPSLQIAKAPDVPDDAIDEVLALEAPDSHPAPPPAPVAASPVAAPALASDAVPAGESDAGRRPRHDEKVTFYCTASDLTRIERARLALRADHKLASDRGRIVRAALAEILDDFESNGASSALVRRLRHDRSS